MNNISEELWLKYFAGEVTSMQKRAIQQYISDPNNAEAYFSALDMWERNNIQFPVNVESAGTKFEDFINTNSIENSTGEVEDTSATGRFAIFNRTWFRSIAAVIILGLAIWLVYPSEKGYVTYVTAKNEVRSILLPDNSSAILNGNSEIRIPNDFKENDTRTIYLDGNARFNIQHTSDHKKFVVNTSHGCRIEVLGTEFDVFSSRDSSRIYLKSGSIKLISKKGSIQKAVLIKPDDVVKIAGDEEIQIEPKQKYWQYKAWEEHRFVFDASSMEEITTMLKKQFNMDIVIEDEDLKKKAISGTYQWEDEKDILYILSDILNFQIEEQGDTFKLKYKN